MSQPVTSSGAIAVGAATVVTARPARCFSVTLVPAAAASTITVYDNASASSGTLVASLSAPANGASIYWEITEGVVCNSGITVTVAGTGAVALVHFCGE